MVKTNLKLNMHDAQNEMLKGKYEIDTGLPIGEGS
jgi:hypothetical protein